MPRPIALRSAALAVIILLGAGSWARASERKGLAPGDPRSLDSLPWIFGFRDPPDGVKSIRLTFVGSKTNGIGLAFNNFSPTFAVPGSIPVPEPSGLALLGSAMLGLTATARRRRG